jgi:NAD(P) transhydrogenase subunit alpha
MPTLFVPRESKSGETRVAATPETVKGLAKAGLTVMVERGAGVPASFTDAMYEAVGAKLCGPARRQ